MIQLIILIIWILDICNANIPILDFLLNDSNNLNGLFWLMIWIFIMPSSINIKLKEK